MSKFRVKFQPLDFEKRPINVGDTVLFALYRDTGMLHKGVVDKITEYRIHIRYIENHHRRIPAYASELYLYKLC